jgi:RNase H-fold protein (predicted Holliday junction resolvase)
VKLIPIAGPISFILERQAAKAMEKKINSKLTSNIPIVTVEARLSSNIASRVVTRANKKTLAELDQLRAIPVRYYHCNKVYTYYTLN